MCLWSRPGAPKLKINAMNTRPERIPGPDHPIAITPSNRRIVIKVAGQVIADSKSALSLKEASYPAVLYVPRSDVDMSKLQRTEHATYCPYKGDCSYYSIAAGGDKAVNAVWTYDKPYSSVASIKEHLAFYPSRVDSIEETAA